MTKKIMALVLAAAITTGIGGFGTYAAFTDQHTLSNEVSITTGTLDVESYWATDGISSWKPVSTVTEVNEESANTLTFTNAKPGDRFQRDIIVYNAGTLEADTRIMINEEVSDKVNVKIVAVDGTETVESDDTSRFVRAMKPNRAGWVRLTVEVTVDQGVENEWMNKVVAGDAHDFIELSAHQTVEN